MTRHAAITPAADDRRDQRHLTVLIVGKVRGVRGEYACVINDVSCRGLQARFPYPPQVGERLTFELRGLPDKSATVRWADGMRGGVEFDSPIDLTAIVTAHPASWVRRGPRFACSKPASLIIDGQGCATTLLDLSLGGAKLEVQPRVRPVFGAAGIVILPVLAEPRAGIVRWHGRGRVGFKFARALTLDALADALAG